MTNPVTAILRQKGHGVHTIPADASVLEAVRRMNDAEIGSLLVMEDGRAVGIFTERDVLTRIIDGGRDPRHTKVSEVMTRPVHTVRATTTVAEAFQLMIERRCRHLPVLEHGRAIGVVSAGDLTRWVVQDQESALQEMTEFVQGTYPR